MQYKYVTVMKSCAAFMNDSLFCQRCDCHKLTDGVLPPLLSFCLVFLSNVFLSISDVFVSALYDLFSSYLSSILVFSPTTFNVSCIFLFNVIISCGVLSFSFCVTSKLTYKRGLSFYCCVSSFLSCVYSFFLASHCVFSLCYV